MSIKLDEKQLKTLLDNFIDNAFFYKSNEFDEVRKLIAIHYADNYEVLEKISTSKNARQLLASSGWLNNIITKITKPDFQFKEKSNEEGLMLVFNMLVLYEDRFFTNLTYSLSLDFLAFSVGIIDEKFIKVDKYEEYESEIDNLYDFFNKTITKIKVDQVHQNNYQRLFNLITKIFVFSAYKHATIWFRFYFLFNDRGKFENNIEQDVFNGTINFIRNSNNANQLKTCIESTMSIQEFYNKSRNYSNEIYNRASTNAEFAFVFYDTFSDKEKQAIVELWSSKTKANFDSILVKVKQDIPDRVNLAKTILGHSRSQNNHNTKEGLFDSLFKLGLTPEELNGTIYSKLIINLICNTNINHHRLGVKLYNTKPEFIDTKALKEKAVPFLFSIITNLNGYNEIFQNILKLKIGIDKRNFDAMMGTTNNAIAHVSQYLTHSGDASFYEVVTSKLLGETIGIIGQKVVEVINSNGKYKDLLEAINRDKGNLSETALNKLDSLINND